MINTPEKPVPDFASQYNIDVSRDTKSNPNITPRLAKLDDSGATVQHISEAGADYTYFLIDYCEGNVVFASRAVSVILPGNHTEFAYWTRAASSKILDVHKGRGALIVGDPESGETRALPVDSNKFQEVTLPAGCFYTLQADKNSTEPFVVSGFYEPIPDWGILEIPLKPGQDSVEAPEGLIHVPANFRAACA
jgi:hypothetical protein